MNLLCSLLFYLHCIWKQKEAGVLWKSTYLVENCCDFSWSSGISITFSNLHFYDYTMLQHFYKRNYTIRKRDIPKTDFWYFQCLKIIQKNFAWGKILSCMLREVEAQVFYILSQPLRTLWTAAQTIWQYQNGTLRKYHWQDIFVSFQPGKLQSQSFGRKPYGNFCGSMPMCSQNNLLDRASHIKTLHLQSVASAFVLLAHDLSSPQNTTAKNKNCTFSSPLLIRGKTWVTLTKCC